MDGAEVHGLVVLAGHATTPFQAVCQFCWSAGYPSGQPVVIDPYGAGAGVPDATGVWLNCVIIDSVAVAGVL